MVTACLPLHGHGHRARRSRVTKGAAESRLLWCGCISLARQLFFGGGGCCPWLPVFLHLGGCPLLRGGARVEGDAPIPPLVGVPRCPLHLNRPVEEVRRGGLLVDRGIIEPQVGGAYITGPGCLH